MGEAGKDTARISKIDLLKFIGILCIILAHVDPPNKVLMVRNFDVPLMVFISAYLGNRSVEKHLGSKGLVAYYWSRIKRLVLPTWFFLIFFFLFQAIVDGVIYDSLYYIYSFTLTGNGIGYVWVILVYLYVALLTPLFHRCRDSFVLPILVIVLYSLYEVACYFGIGNSGVLAGATFTKIIPYGSVAFLGANYERMGKKTRAIFTAGFGIVFLGFLAYLFKKTGWFVNVQDYKYPPRLYYLSFGLFASFALFKLCDFLPRVVTDNPFVTFVSTNSLDIYLCHIFILNLYERINISPKWYMKYAIVCATTFIVVWVYREAVKLIKCCYRKKNV